MGIRRTNAACAEVACAAQAPLLPTSLRRCPPPATVPSRAYVTPAPPRGRPSPRRRTSQRRPPRSPSVSALRADVPRAGASRCGAGAAPPASLPDPGGRRQTPAVPKSLPAPHGRRPLPSPRRHLCLDNGRAPGLPRDHVVPDEYSGPDTTTAVTTTRTRSSPRPYSGGDTPANDPNRSSPDDDLRTAPAANTSPQLQCHAPRSTDQVVRSSPGRATRRARRRTTPLNMRTTQAPPPSPLAQPPLWPRHHNASTQQCDNGVPAPAPAPLRSAPDAADYGPCMRHLEDPRARNNATDGVTTTLPTCVPVTTAMTARPLT